MKTQLLWRGMSIMAIALPLVGCVEHDRICDDEKEIDFAAIKEMAGTWVDLDGAMSFRIEADGRPYSFTDGPDEVKFNCARYALPLVLNDPTSWNSGFERSWQIELVGAKVSIGYLRLEYNGAWLGIGSLHAISLDEDHLQLIVDNELPEVLTRICDNLCDPKTGLPLDEDSSE